MPLPFNKSLDLKLIKLVRENPILYDIKHMKYMDFDSRDVVWQKIGDQLSRPACEFAGLQCQIIYGDYEEEKHKAGGYMDYYKQLLPTNFSNKGGLEKKISKEHMKHKGLSSFDAMHLYTKTARALPTYGVTFFVVKEKQSKGKKKLVPRLLGISASAILRLDEETKEILQAWPLTHVKSYQVGKSHTFTLDFGDYSDKEYSVKSNDAIRIRDILHGYIDIIAKSRAGAHNMYKSDGQTIMEDSVMASRGNFVQVVQNNPSKVLEESFVGPSKIVSYEPGQTASQGTQLVTVQQVIVTNKIPNQQYTVSGDVPHRKGMSLEFVRKLNRMNSNSVKVVNLITSDDGPHTAELTSIVKAMENDLPFIVTGVNEIVKTADMDEESKSRLQSELQELTDLLNLLSKHTHGDDPTSEDSLLAASSIADVSTRMYLGLDPLTKRRSNLVRMSRESFIADDKISANIRRASFVSVADSAHATVDTAAHTVTQAYDGPALTSSQVEEIQKAALEKMRKLNGAVALFLTAHADLDNVDYPEATKSVNAINKLIMELAKDAQALASSKDGADKEELINDIRQLCEATKLVCGLAGSGDQLKKQDVTNAYAPAADKLIFRFGRGRRDDRDNTIIDLAKAAGEKTSLLLMKANSLTEMLDAHHSEMLDEAGVQCAAAGSDLLSCAVLTSPCIHEPHCRSALTASVETLASSAQKLMMVAKPALEDKALKRHGEELKDLSLELASALDALKNAFDDENNSTGDANPVENPQRLKFLMRLKEAANDFDELDREVNKPLVASKPDKPPSPVVASILEKTLELKMAEYNAAVADLLVAASDRGNQDFATAEAAIVKIYEALPVIVKDARALAAVSDATTRSSLVRATAALCDVTRQLCAAASGDVTDLNSAAEAVANTSNKLSFTFSKSAPRAKEREIVEIASAACAKASFMLSTAEQLAQHTSAAQRELIDVEGAAVAEKAKALLTCAQLTASPPRQPLPSLARAAVSLSCASRSLSATCAACGPLADNVTKLQEDLDHELDKLKRACGADKGKSPSENKQKLQFVKSAAAAKTELHNMAKALDEPSSGPSPSEEAVRSRQRHLSATLATLSAAVATLTRTTADPVNPDYTAAKEAMNIINETLPEVIKDSKSIADAQDGVTREGMLENARALCDAFTRLCDNADDPKAMRRWASDVGACSGKLVFSVNPRARRDIASMMIESTQAAYKTASQLVKSSRLIARQLTNDVTQIADSAARTADAADGLLLTAQLTAPCLASPACQSTLLSSADLLSSSALDLASRCGAVEEPQVTSQVKEVQDQRRVLEDQLKRVKEFCLGVKEPQHVRTPEEEANRLKFEKSAAAAKTGLTTIEKEFNKPSTGECSDVLSRQHQLGSALARLNSAMATLATATADPDDPDYAAAEEAMAVITELMPLVVKDTRAMAQSKDEKSSAAILSDLRALCDATRDICDASSDPQQLREASKRFGAASGKLVYVLNPKTRPDDANKVIKHANEVCAAARQLIKESNNLADSLYASDVAASKIRMAADNTLHAVDTLLTATQLTAPSLKDSHCQAALLSSLEALHTSAQELSQQWTPIQSEEQSVRLRRLDGLRAELLRRLDEMRDDCFVDCPLPYNKGDGVAEKARFADAVATTKAGLKDVEKELAKPYTGTLPKGQALSFRQLQLSNGLARLNAALAGLAVATTDLDNADYAGADEAMNIIRETLPQVVKDTKAMAAVRDDASGEVMLGNARAMCLATAQICDQAEKDPKALRQFAKNFAKASGKLLYRANSRSKQRSEQVMESTQTACDTATQLVNTSNRLLEQLAGDDVRQKIADSGVRTTDAADALLTAAQLTSPCINDVNCQRSFSTSIDRLSSSAQHLKSHWVPLLQEPLFSAVIRQLEKESQQLTEELGQLKQFCQDSKKGISDPKKEEIKKKEAFRNQYISKAAAAVGALADADKELDKPVVGYPAKGEAASAQEMQVTQQLAKLHAALLTLSISTADNNDPDYETAEKSINTITELVPHVIKNVNTYLAGKDGTRQKEIVPELRELVRGVQEICSSVQQQDSSKVNDLLTKDVIPRMSNLYCEVHPKAGSAKLVKVESLAKSAGCKASEALTSVFQLPASAASGHLDQCGAGTADKAKALLTAVQLTGPYIHTPEGQSTLISTADALTSSAQELSTLLAKHPAHQDVKNQVTRDLQGLEMELDKFRQACRDPERTSDPKEEEIKKKEALRNQYISKAAAAIGAMAAAQKELDKPVVGYPASGEAASAQEMQVTQQLAKLHAALLTLSIATADNNDPDYETAEKSIDTITELVPHVVKNVNTYLAGKDGTRQQEFVPELRALVRGVQEICSSVQQQDSSKVNDLLTKDVIPRMSKLYYEVHPKAGSAKLVKVESLAKSAGCKASEALTSVFQLPASAASGHLDQCGAGTADKAKALLTAVQLTGPYIHTPEGQATLISTADALTSSAQELSTLLAKHPAHQDVKNQVTRDLQGLEMELDKFRQACRDPESTSDPKEEETKKKEALRNQYISKAAAAIGAMAAAQKELDKPVVGFPASGEAASAQLMQVTQQLAKLHAALLTLSIATADNNDPDYETAEKSIDTITELVPHVVKNVNTYLAGKDGTRQQEIVPELRALVRGLQEICSSVQQQDSSKVNDLLTKDVIPRMSKLYCEVHPKAGSAKLVKVESLAKSAGCKASEALTSVFQLPASAASGHLDQCGAGTADKAKALLTAVQLTGPYIHTPEGQATLISTADALTSSAQELSTLLAKHPAHQDVKNQVTRDLQGLEMELDKFRQACRDPEPEITVQKPATRPKPPAPPRRASSEEGKLKFTAAMEKVNRGLRAAEEDVKKVFESTLDAPKMRKDQVRGVQKALEKKIALVNVATSGLLVCNAAEPVDYAAAVKNTSDLATLLPKIAQDAKVLANTMPEKQRKEFLDDILAMFDSTKNVIDAAQNNRQNLNGVAVEFGNKSGSLLYSVSTDFDPSHEKEVISRAKAIGECISSLTERSADVITSEGDGMLCARGKACVTAAGNLVYTAKLVAPSIQVQECREILMESSQILSNKMKAFSEAWQPLSSDPQHQAAVQDMNAITAKTQGLLEELKKDLDSGKLVKMRPLELLEVEDTPLRKMAAALVQGAMKKSTISSLTPEQKRALVEYGRVLTDASDRLDRANAVCKKNPHDLEKRRELEDAVQNLLVLALQSRPSLGEQKDQLIVDLTEYVKDLSQEAEKMITTAASCSVKHQKIDKECREITEEAECLMQPSNYRVRGDDTTVDDIHEVDRFGMETEGRVERIASEIQALPDSKDKILLNTQSVILEDSCNILRFASQSAIATAQSASLDDQLQTLVDFEGRLDDVLEKRRNNAIVNEPISWPVRSSLLQAACDIPTQHVTSSLMQYVDEQRARTDVTDPEAKKRLQEHLRKLLYYLRVLTVESGRRVATWQQAQGPSVKTITEQVIREIDYGCSLNQPKVHNSVLEHIDLNRLLLSSDVIRIEGDRKQLEAKQRQSASKLASMLSTVVASSPGSMSRSLTATAEAASELAALARAQHCADPVQKAKIEEAARDLTFQTYNVLKAAETVSQDPNNTAYRRRLLDACRSLNDAINKLGRSTSTEKKMQRECTELTRNLQLNQTLSETVQPTCALPYAECLDALANQQEIIQKLSSDQPMTREEFSSTLGFVSSAVCNSTELASHCGYLMSLSERDRQAATVGVVDVPLIQKVTESTRAACYRVLQFDGEQAKEEAITLLSELQAVKDALQDAQKKSLHMKEEIQGVEKLVAARGEELRATLAHGDKAKISTATNNLLDSLQSVSTLTDHPALVPMSGDLTEEQKNRQQTLLVAARDLNSKTVSLIRDVKNHVDRRGDDDDDDDDGSMTWVTFNLKRKDVVKAFEDLLANVRENGQKAGILKVEQKEEEPTKSFVQIQVELANKWLKRPNCKPEVKATGEGAVRKIIDVAEKMATDMKESEREDMCVMVAETKELLDECSKKCSPDKASQLVDRVRSLRKAIERGVITMVVEDLMEEEEPLQDLELLADSESDASKRKYLLERKIAELLAQLARVTRTARALDRAGLAAPNDRVELNTCTEQANLLAPLLVKAAQERIESPDNKAAVENYKSMLSQYAQSLTKVRELCDRSVDPMEFVQTAGETMQRMREESSNDNDTQKCVYTSSAITRLANRVIQVSMSSANARQDPELRRALSEAQQRLAAAAPGPDTRLSRMPDWKDTTAEILRTTEKVEAVMGGELIFQNQPQSDQPIFAAARDLHAAVREWSARDNELVASAKKTAVLMARLSAHMNNNAQHEVLVTSQQLVSSSREVADLARKLALECHDLRIKTNLLQVCDQIPTISGQLKMLTTVKGSSLNSGNKENQESLNMLVDNAQNLMQSIQQVVKVSAGASVKIASQRGGLRVRWVRKTYY